MINYSIATKKDLDDVSQLFVQVYSGILNQVFRKSPGKGFVKDILEVYLDSAKGGFIIAKDKGNVVAFVCGVKSVLNLWKHALKPKRAFKFLFTLRQIFIMPPRLGHIFHAHVPLMGVRKEYRLKGIGLKLSDKVLSSLKKQGARKAYFQIPISLIDTYVKHGCELLKRKKKWAIMRKRL